MTGEACATHTLPQLSSSKSPKNLAKDSAPAGRSSRKAGGHLRRRQKRFNCNWSHLYCHIRKVPPTVSQTFFPGDEHFNGCLNRCGYVRPSPNHALRILPSDVFRVVGSRSRLDLFELSCQTRKSVIQTRTPAPLVQSRHVRTQTQEDALD
jgi:hypothetical protein